MALIVQWFCTHTRPPGTGGAWMGKRDSFRHSTAQGADTAIGGSRSGSGKLCDRHHTVRHVHARMAACMATSTARSCIFPSLRSYICPHCSQRWPGGRAPPGAATGPPQPTTRHVIPVWGWGLCAHGHGGMGPRCAACPMMMMMMGLYRNSGTRARESPIILSSHHCKAHENRVRPCASPCSQRGKWQQHLGREGDVKPSGPARTHAGISPPSPIAWRSGRPATTAAR